MTAAALICPRCGTPNREDAWYCNLCQESFRKPRAAAAQAAPAPGAPRAAPPAAIVTPPPVPPAAPAAPAAARVALLPSAPGGAPADAAPGPQPAPRHGGGAALLAAAGTRPGAAGRPGAMLSFYDAAAGNARNTVVLFASLLATYLALGAVIGMAYRLPGEGLAVALVLFTVMGAAAWYGGASLVLSAHEAREADPGRDRVVLNVVEEMAIASGLPKPRVYVMETDGMNAFAAGRTPGEAVVAVTTGLASRLTRDELQGVVAHEMAHIKGRDTLYNICAAVLVGSIALLSDMFLRGSLSRGRGASPGRGVRGSGVYLLLGILLALLAPLAAKLLQMSISREREYRADAGAAEFTRNPLGLASALEKIAAGGAQVPGGNRGTQHLFIVNPLRAFSDDASALMSTHPPTERRIQRLRAMAGAAAS